ncbi:MAG: HDIG domain-containing protein, partial [Candidatus Jacksonbacteria bacterium]|nr:HDIG domain-containing protein [Candidatus Jacksonbacteria bacterium]
ERFQLIFGGSELCNGYSELNDPLDQRARFEEQQKMRESGDREAQMADEDFVEALEYGMPPVCGLGISERLFAFLEGKSVRECTMFPLLKPAHRGTEESGDEEKAGMLSLEHQEDDTVEIKDIGITRKKALDLLYEHIKNQNLIKHHLSVEIQMRALAEYFQKQGIGGVNPDAWAIAGLLHDMDWEITESEPKRHSLMTADILNKKGVHPAIVEAIRVHNHIHGIEPKTLMEKALYCAEELTGLVVASALVQPDKKLSSVDVPSVIKKFKDKAFARGVNREIIFQCEPMLGLSLEKLTAITLSAMQEKAGELGL